MHNDAGSHPPDQSLTMHDCPRCGQAGHYYGDHHRDGPCLYVYLVCDNAHEWRVKFQLYPTERGDRDRLLVPREARQGWQV